MPPEIYIVEGSDVWVYRYENGKWIPSHAFAKSCVSPSFITACLKKFGAYSAEYIESNDWSVKR